MGGMDGMDEMDGMDGMDVMDGMGGLSSCLYRVAYPVDFRALSNVKWTCQHTQRSSNLILL